MQDVLTWVYIIRWTRSETIGLSTKLAEGSQVAPVHMGRDVLTARILESARLLTSSSIYYNSIGSWKLRLTQVPTTNEIGIYKRYRTRMFDIFIVYIIFRDNTIKVLKNQINCFAVSWALLDCLNVVQNIRYKMCFTTKSSVIYSRKVLRGQIL